VLARATTVSEAESADVPAPAPRDACLRMNDLPEPSLAYSIDADDRVLSVSPTWDAFAAENGGPHLHSAGIVGEPLFRLAPGSAPFYGPLLVRVRARDRPVEFPFRCDTPDARRLLRMRMEPGLSGVVHFATTVIQVQRRAPVSLETSAPGVRSVVLIMCSWCKRVSLSSQWVEIELAVAELALAAHALPTVSHGICPACVAGLELLLADLEDAPLSIQLPPESDRRG